jgi:Skp family chaperone for outer membrane proteins
MRRLPILILACIVCAAVAAETASPPIASLNLQEVMNKAKLMQSRMDDIKRQGDAARDRLKGYEDKVKEISGWLELRLPADPEYSKKQLELELTKTERKLYHEQTRNTLERAQVAALRDAFAVIRGQLKSFCEERDISLVLLQPDTNFNLPNMSIQEMSFSLGMQSVLYSKNSLDITEPFLSYLNARTADAAPAPGGAAPVPAPPMLAP